MLSSTGAVQQSVAEVALEKIATEEKESQHRKKAFLALPSGRDADVSASDFVQYFCPELPKQFGDTGWTNGAKHLPRTHMLLFAPPHQFDIYPVPIEDFRKYHGLDFSSYKFLVERRLVIPNLYFRQEGYWKQSKNWSRLDYLRPLIEASSVTGRRCDAYFESIFPEYGSPVHNEKLIRSAFERVKLNDTSEFYRILGGDARDEREDIVRERCESRVIREAIRLQHVEIFSEPRANSIKNFLEMGKVADAFESIRIGQIARSPISSALGGDFLWDRSSLDQLFASEPDAEVAAKCA